MSKDNLKEKYPYLGYSPNLIEYFGIIGYQEEFIPQVIKEITKGGATSTNSPYSPTILNSVISNIDYGTTDNDLMLHQIYPDNPNFIRANPNDYKDQIPPPSSIIYSFCFDSTDGKKKLFYTCYAYKFYEIYKNPNKNNNEIYYAPKAFSIISQYAFFNTFHYICENLLNLIKLEGKNNLPMEIVIYSLLNYLPTPMNYKINLDIFEFLKKSSKSITLDQLSGYPYIDFDLSEIFNLLPINLILEIYIITFLEQKTLFFSQNLEILNMIMYIMFSLNYPCNDSIYFWHIVSVPLKELTEENRFVGKVMDSLLGVNSSYDEFINTSPFGSYYFIVDIDNKKIILKNSNLNQEEEEDYKDLIKIQEFLQNSIKDKNIDSTFLKNFIKELKTSLENILNKDVNYTPNPKNKYVNFFKLPKSMDKNKKIQESFYNFCLNVLKMFYKDNELNPFFDKITNKESKLRSELNINGKQVSLPEGEKLFCEFFRDSIKYKIYYENFIQNFDTMDIFKIPLLFSEEFINLKINDVENNLLSNISFFKIIDTLYIQSFPQTINIKINNIYSEYNENMKNDFKHLISDNKNELEKQLFCLNRKILNKFIYILNNKYEKEEIMDLFPSTKLQSSDFISFFDKRCIKDIIQNYLINKDIIKTSHCIIYSVVYVFALTMSLHPFSELLTYLSEILKSLNSTPFFKRYYINVIIQTFHNYFLINEKENSYPNMNLIELKMYYLIIVNYLKQNGIIPDEEMMSVLSYFFGRSILKEREKNAVKNENNNNRNNNYQFVSKTPFQIKFKYNFNCIMKYSFQSNGTIKQRKMVKAALRENRISNIIINTKKKILHPIILVRIKDYIYTSEFYSSIKILKNISQLYTDFFENFNFDLKKIDLKLLREMITNLIQYATELNSVNVPLDFLIYTLYALREVDKMKKDNNNIIIEKQEDKKEDNEIKTDSNNNQ